MLYFNYLLSYCFAYHALKTSSATSDMWILQYLKVSLWSVCLDFEKNEIQCLKQRAISWRCYSNHCSLETSYTWNFDQISYLVWKLESFSRKYIKAIKACLPCEILISKHTYNGKKNCRASLNVLIWL